VDLLHQITIQFDSKRHQAERLIEFALFAPVYGNGSLLADASGCAGSVDLALYFQADILFQISSFHGLFLVE
jgi:hypothetical protein